MCLHLSLMTRLLTGDLGDDGVRITLTHLEVDFNMSYWSASPRRSQLAMRGNHAHRTSERVPSPPSRSEGTRTPPHLSILRGDAMHHTHLDRGVIAYERPYSPRVSVTIAAREIIPFLIRVPSADPLYPLHASHKPGSLRSDATFVGSPLVDIRGIESGGCWNGVRSRSCYYRHVRRGASLGHHRSIIT